MKDKRIITWQRLEGFALLAVTIFWYIKYSSFQAWGPVIFFFILPDISIAAYLINTKFGALCYNLTHSGVLPLSVFAIWLINPRPIILYLGLAWLAHIGMDRAFGFGLKYDDDFKHTHLGRIGK